MNLTKTRKAFTLVELLVVVAMIAVIMGAMTTSVTASQERARIQKATSEVKVISQAILAYENYAQDYELPTLNDVDADAGSVGFLLGRGETSALTGNQVPAVLMASLSSGGKMLDPWGTPYRIRIQPGPLPSIGSQKYKTGYFYPNMYRLSEEERK